MGTASSRCTRPPAGDFDAAGDVGRKKKRGLGAMSFRSVRETQANIASEKVVNQYKVRMHAQNQMSVQRSRAGAGSGGDGMHKRLPCKRRRV